MRLLTLPPPNFEDMERRLRCHFAVVTASAAIVLLPSPLNADWQYARWGMSPEDVIAAAEGHAESLAEPEIVQSVSVVGLVKASYETADYQFKVTFFFSKTESKLAATSLELENTALGPSLYAALVRRYGEPIEQDESVTPAGVLQMARWNDRENNNLVRWFEIQGAFSIEFRPLVGDWEPDAYARACLRGSPHGPRPIEMPREYSLLDPADRTQIAAPHVGPW